MNKMKGIVFTIAFGLIFAFGTLLVLRCVADCLARGGVYAQGPIWFECVERVKL